MNRYRAIHGVLLADQTLQGVGYATDQRADTDRAAYEVARARLACMRAERDQAANQSQAMKSALAFWKQRLEDMIVLAPQGGVIERIYRLIGEIVAAGDPVVALRPAGAAKIRFYAPQPLLSSISTGERIALSCDGRRGDLSARVSLICGTPQFTPPAIDGPKERAKLAFLVEAVPDARDVPAPSGLLP
ncbi:MAG: HlyD family efflux transporter periplasmic adaptor subunit [Parvularculaceae bacterium]